MLRRFNRVERDQEMVVVSSDNLHLEKAVTRLVFHREGVSDPGMRDEP